MMYCSASAGLTCGGGPPSVAQLNSDPGSRPGTTMAPVFGFLTAEYIAFAESTCAAVRHDGASSPLHCSTFGSQWQASGGSSPPSFTPSRPSHACNTASWIIGYFVAGIVAAGVL